MRVHADTHTRLYPPPPRPILCKPPAAVPEYRPIGPGTRAGERPRLRDGVGGGDRSAQTWPVPCQPPPSRPRPVSLRAPPVPCAPILCLQPLGSGSQAICPPPRRPSPAASRGLWGPSPTPSLTARARVLRLHLISPRRGCGRGGGRRAPRTHPAERADLVPARNSAKTQPAGGLPPPCHSRSLGTARVCSCHFCRTGGQFCSPHTPSPHLEGFSQAPHLCSFFWPPWPQPPSTAP